MSWDPHPSFALGDCADKFGNHIPSNTTAHDVPKEKHNAPPTD